MKRQVALIVLLGSFFRKVEKKEGHDTRGCASSAGKVQRQTCWIGVDLCQRMVRLDLLVIKFLTYTFLSYYMQESVGPPRHERATAGMLAQLTVGILQSKLELEGAAAAALVHLTLQQSTQALFLPPARAPAKHATVTAHTLSAPPSLLVFSLLHCCGLCLREACQQLSAARKACQQVSTSAARRVW